MTDSVKPPRRRLTRPQIVTAALGVADAEGVEGLTVRRLAAALEVSPMAIYRHVRGKNHVLDLMADELLGELDVGSTEAPTWQEALRRLAGSLLVVLQEHSSAAFLLSRPFESPAALRVSEAMLSILDRAGFDTAEAVRMVQVMTGMVLGPAIHRATYAAASRQRPRDDPAEPARAEALPSAEYPHLASAVDRLLDWSAGAEEDWLVVELLVNGLEALAAGAGRGLEPATRQ
jgi:AcrR family transcriptional regulator